MTNVLAEIAYSKSIKNMKVLCFELVVDCLSVMIMNKIKKINSGSM